jgi:GxxExxY protein
MAYKGDPLVQMYNSDFLCFDKIIVELKAVKEIIPDHEAQLLHYLKATGMRVGLLANFGSYPQAQVERRVL